MRRESDGWAFAPDTGPEGLWYDPYPGAYFPDDPGGGPPFLELDDPDTGEHRAREWWAETLTPDDDCWVDPEKLTWPALLSKWTMIETDFHHFYGADLESPEVLHHRTWRWFTVRVFRLISEDTALGRYLRPPRD